MITKLQIHRKPYVSSPEILHFKSQLMALAVTDTPTDGRTHYNMNAVYKPYL